MSTDDELEAHRADPLERGEPSRCGKCGGGHPCDCAGFTKMAPWESHVGEPSALRPIKYLDDGPEGDPVEWLFAIASEGRPGDPVLRPAVEHYRDQQAVMKFLVKRAEAAEGRAWVLNARLNDADRLLTIAKKLSASIGLVSDISDWQNAADQAAAEETAGLPESASSNTCPGCGRSFSTPQGLGLHFKAKAGCGGKP